MFVPVLHLIKNNQIYQNKNVTSTPTWHSLLQYHLLEQPAQTNSDFFCPQPWHSGVFFFPSSFFPFSLSFSTLGLAAALCKFLLALSSTEENLVSTSPLLPLLAATLGLLGEGLLLLLLRLLAVTEVLACAIREAPLGLGWMWRVVEVEVGGAVTVWEVGRRRTCCWGTMTGWR